ncbi:MAG: hypothetical protein V5A27_11770 [Halapricum sp.]
MSPETGPRPLSVPHRWPRSPPTHQVSAGEIVVDGIDELPFERESCHTLASLAGHEDERWADNGDDAD